MDHVRLEVWVDYLMLFLSVFTRGCWIFSAITNCKIFAYEPAFTVIRDRSEHLAALQRRAVQMSSKIEENFRYQYRKGKLWRSLLRNGHENMWCSRDRICNGMWLVYCYR